MNHIEQQNTLLIIPTYNEAQNIDDLLKLVWTTCPSIHTLVVDDNSNDGTANLVKSAQVERAKQLHILERPGKLGLASAYIDGFKWGMARGYKAFIEMDADFSHNPKVIPTMIALLSKHSAVIGSRYVAGGGTENWHPARKLISQFGSLYARTILGMSVRDLTGGFNAWTLEALRAIDLDSITSDGYSFQIELKYRCHKSGLSLIETPITFSERREGQSKMSIGIVIEAFYKVWTFRSGTNDFNKALTSGKTTAR